MARHTGFWRSNRFAVRDLSRFHNWCSGLDVIYDIEDDERVVLYHDGRTGLFPDDVYFDENDKLRITDPCPTGFMDELSEHLAPEPDNVCVLVQATARGVRWVRGEAWAIRSPELGDPYMVQVSIDDIYHRAKKVFRLKDEPEPAHE
jgi:hypothetical protein